MHVIKMNNDDDDDLKDSFDDSKKINFLKNHDKR